MQEQFEGNTKRQGALADGSAAGKKPAYYEAPEISDLGILKDLTHTDTSVTWG